MLALSIFDEARAVMVQLVEEDHYWVLSVDRDRLDSMLALGRDGTWASALLAKHRDREAIRPKDLYDALLLAARQSMNVSDESSARARFAELEDLDDSTEVPVDRKIMFRFYRSEFARSRSEHQRADDLHADAQNLLSRSKASLSPLLRELLARRLLPAESSVLIKLKD